MIGFECSAALCKSFNSLLSASSLGVFLWGRHQQPRRSSPAKFECKRTFWVYPLVFKIDLLARAYLHSWNLLIRWVLSRSWMKWSCLRSAILSRSLGTSWYLCYFCVESQVGMRLPFIHLISVAVFETLLFNWAERSRANGLPSTASFPDKNNLMHFNITISPDEGFWKGPTAMTLLCLGISIACFKADQSALRSKLHLRLQRSSTVPSRGLVTASFEWSFASLSRRRQK